MKTISSPDNPLIRTVRRLQRRTGARDKARIILEGIKLASEALDNRIPIEQAVVSRTFLMSEAGESLATRLVRASVEVVQVPDRLLGRMSSLESPEGILLLARMTARPLASLAGNLILVLARVQDPGNVGAMARVAEAAGAAALVKCRGSADPFQPKALRASMGSLLRLPVFEVDVAERSLPELAAKGFTLAGCVPRGGEDYREADLEAPLAVVVGSESSGFPATLAEYFDLRLSVPMKEPVESLNVAVVAALVLYEVARRRQSL